VLPNVGAHEQERSSFVMQRLVRLVVLGCYVVAVTGQSYAQGGGDWMTVGNDAQRSFWVRGDAKISPDTLGKPGFQLLWKIKPKNESRQLNSLTPPVLFDFYIGYRGFRSLGLIGGSSDRVIGIDVDLAHIEWEKSLVSHSLASVSILCPGGMTSGVTRPTMAGYLTAGGRGSGRSGPAKSGVGEPLEGAVTLKEREIEAAEPPPPTSPGGRIAAPPDPYAPSVKYVHAVTSDGKFHSLYVSNGEEPNPPIPFLPPQANALGLIVFDKAAYVATVNGCSGVENGVWALNIESKKVTHWKSGGEVAGSAGFAVGPDGTLFVASSDGELVALEPGTLAVKSSYKAGKEFSSSPVVFDFKHKDVIAVATRDGQMQLLDSAALSSQPLSSTPPFSSANFATGALASWQDPSGTRWVLAPAAGSTPVGAGFPVGNGEVRNGAIVAFEVAEENGALKLLPRWASRDMVSPLPPAIVHGVVFALSSGEFRPNDGSVAAAQRAQRSSKAVLYALDAATGKELWNSGNTISSFVHSGGLAAGGGRVYVGGYDGTQYAFGFPVEH
jgi:outer membrane protein assembly factor BamB